MSCKLEPAIWSRDTGQRIPSFDRCQLIILWMSNIKKVHGKQRLHICQSIIWSMAAMLRDSVVVAVVRTRPRAIPLAMITMRKSTHGFPFLCSMSMGLRLAALRAAGAPLLTEMIINSISLLLITFNKFERSKSGSNFGSKNECKTSFQIITLACEMR